MMPSTFVLLHLAYGALVGAAYSPIADAPHWR
jgi:hypothetical protein